MKYAKVMWLALVVVLALGSLGSTLAQDTLAKVDLVLWSSDDDVNNDALVAQFAAWAELRAPGSTIDLQKKETETLRNDFTTAGLAGSGLPEMVLGPNDNMGPFVDAGLIVPLDELFDTSLYPTNLAGAQVDGVTYGLPISSGNHLMLMYNKSLVPTAPDTFEDLVKVAQDVQAANEDVVGFAFNQTEPFWFVPVVFGFGGSIWNEDFTKMTMDSQEWVDSFKFFQDLKYANDPMIMPTECNYDCANNLFKEGGAAMILNGDWAINEYLDVEKSPALGEENLGLAPWPKLPNGERPRPYTSGKFISIPVTVEGEKLDAVVDFLTWVTTDPAPVAAISVDTGRLPAVAGVEVDNPILAASAEALASGVGMPPTGLRCMWDSVRPNMQAVLNNAMTPEDAAAESQFAAEECLAAS